MTLARLSSILAGALLVLSQRVSAAPPANEFHLKPGAQGKLCVGCHSDFEDKLKLKGVHTPVKLGDCVDCHAPHASPHGKLLFSDASHACSTCHDRIVPKDAKSVHAAVLDGGCVHCHDPHASPNTRQLITAGNALCLSCHKTLADSIEADKFKHPPVTQNCLGCHDPHASKTDAKLLAKPEAALCTSCHKSDQAGFVKAHDGYPVTKGRCTSCHDPHGSNNTALLWPTVHPPVASRNCKQCHNDPTAANALETKKTGIDACRSCHGEVINEALTAKRLHWAVVEGAACLNCHGPHASKEPALLKAPQKTVCATCHADTAARQAGGASKHKPAEDGQCVACHRPHAGDQPFLLKGAGIIETCAACHDWTVHSSHPLGEKSKDLRNANLPIDCRSCHRAHGTSHKFLMPFDHKAEMCTQCHRQLRR